MHSSREIIEPIIGVAIFFVTCLTNFSGDVGIMFLQPSLVMIGRILLQQALGLFHKFVITIYYRCFVKRHGLSAKVPVVQLFKRLWL